MYLRQLLVAALAVLAMSAALNSHAQNPGVIAPPNGMTDWVLCRGASINVPASSTAEQIQATCSIYPNTLGRNGCLRIFAGWTVTNSVNNKTMKIYWGGPSGTTPSISTQGAIFNSYAWVVVCNANATNVQHATAFRVDGSTPAIGSTMNMTVDTTQGTSVVISCQTASAGETCRVDNYLVELFPGS